MNTIARLQFELQNLKRIVTTRTFLIYLYKIAAHLPEIVRTKTLVPADQAMCGVIEFTLGFEKVLLPLAEISQALRGHDNTPTFGGAREMYSGNPYLRAFKDEFTATNVLDLGSNRGLFLMQAAAVLKAKTAIGVEGQNYTDQHSNVFRTIMAILGVNSRDTSNSFNPKRPTKE